MPLHLLFSLPGKGKGVRLAGIEQFNQKCIELISIVDDEPPSGKKGISDALPKGMGGR